MLKIRSQLYHVGALVALIAFGSGCSGGICAASMMVLEDVDADCVDDETDNCVSVSQPGATYNPEQFDGDEDGLGVPCDGDDTDETAALVKDVAFNVGGVYAFSSDCGGFKDLTLTQNGTALNAFDASEAVLPGRAAIGPDGAILHAEFSDGIRDCALDVDVLTNGATLNCATAEGLCTALGERAAIQLWSEDVIDLEIASEGKAGL